MTHTTPTEAREVADRLEAKKLDASTWVAVTALRSLAEQLEVVTEKRDFAVESAKCTADLCTQALAELKVMTAERDEFKQSLHGWIACNAPDGWVDELRKERDAYTLDAGRYNYILECECKAVKTYLGDIDFDAHKNIIRSKHDAAIAKEAK